MFVLFGLCYYIKCDFEFDYFRFFWGVVFWVFVISSISFVGVYWNIEF